MSNGNIIGNRGGIVYTTATLTTAGSSSANAVYTLPNHTFRFLGPAGLIVVTIPTASGTVTGVTINVNNQSLTLTDNTEAAITSLTAGEHLWSFNKTTNTIKALT